MSPFLVYFWKNLWKHGVKWVTNKVQWRKSRTFVMYTRHWCKMFLRSCLQSRWWRWVIQLSLETAVEWTGVRCCAIHQDPPNNNNNNNNNNRHSHIKIKQHFQLYASSIEYITIHPRQRITLLPDEKFSLFHYVLAKIILFSHFH